MEKQFTQVSIKNIMMGLILYIFSGTVGGIISMMFDASSMFSEPEPFDATSVIIKILFAAATVYGLYLYMKGLKTFAAQLDEMGQNGLKLVLTGVILTIVGAIVSVLPLLGGVIATICVLVAAIISLIGFNKLKQSNAIGEAGLKAAKTLSLSALLLVIAEGVDFIPLMGWAAYILLILHYIFLFIGWNRMKQAFE